MIRSMRLSLAVVAAASLLAACDSSSKPAEPPKSAKGAPAAKPAAAAPAAAAAAAPAAGGEIDIAKLTAELAANKGKTVTVSGFLVSTTTQAEQLNVSVGTTADVGAKEGVLCIADAAAAKDAFSKIAQKSPVKVTGKVSGDAFFGKPKLTECVVAK